MKLILAALLSSAMPHVFGSLAGRVHEPQSVSRAVIVAPCGSPKCSVALAPVFVQSGSHAVATGKGSGVAVWRPVDGTEVKGNVYVVASGDDDEVQGKGWLGVSLDRVPEALAAQLEEDGEGVLVINVAKDSPAEKAGLQVHDIIVSVGGSVVENGMTGAAKLIRSKSAGEKVNLVIVRGGKEKTVTVTMGDRSDFESGKVTWKFETAPDAEVEDRVETRGKILRKAPGGEWVFEDLGDLHDLKMLPDKIRMMIPKSGKRSTQLFVGDEGKTVKIDVERDGKTIVIEQEKDGEIVVTRTDKNGKDTTETYADADALAKADPEAADLYREADKSVVIHLDVDGLGKVGNFKFRIDGIEDIQNQVEESMEKAKESYEEAMEKLHGHLMEMAQQWHHAPHGSAQDGRSEPPMPPSPPDFFGHGMFGKPKHQFEVRTDGTIEVRFRKGDSELVQLYQNENDLSKRAPDLYRKYKDLMDEDDE